MKLNRIKIRNFRRLEDIEINIEEAETVFVGPNNSGKTSATTAFRLFLIKHDFKIHDFTISKITAIDDFGNLTEEIGETTLPTIEMNLWFTINPETEYGRVASLIPDIPDLIDSFTEVGVRLKYEVKDAQKLKTSYVEAKKLDKSDTIKSLSYYLSMGNNLSHHFEMTYFALDKDEKEFPISPREGKRTINSLIRVDFIDAQRNMDDQELGRSNRLSAAFTEFYKKNLEQAEVSEEANRVIDENNQSLTTHYGTHFDDLLQVIGGLGFPSINDRQIQLISSLSPETLLQGNTTLLYVDEESDHELPEAYNGLGFKNLVYMAIQVSHFHSQWMRTKEKRPLCQIIFIEEPEVHLHAQVQQTFIQNVWKIVEKASQKANESHMIPQLLITTHSSHILDTVDFSKARYFKRCCLDGEDLEKVIKLNASKVMNLHDFKVVSSSSDDEDTEKHSALLFLEKYLKLTHCDLFFADAAILIEGSSEKLLLPQMIDKSASKLRHSYLTVLEVGGAYAHRFAEILQFIGLPYLVITDLDSIDPTDKRKACRADKLNARTSNETIKYFLNKDKISDLSKLEAKDKVLAGGDGYIVFQQPTLVTRHSKPMCGRTFEEAFIYENLDLFRDQNINLSIEFNDVKNFEQEYDDIYQGVRTSLKKTEFALDVVISVADWNTPSYIKEGLLWLAEKMTNNS